MPPKLLAYHGDPAIKDKYLSRVRAHIAADELIHGKYWENGKGCAVGCTIHSGNHADYEKQLGIPRVLAKLEDGIFESMPNGRSKEWPEQFLSVIPVSANLALVWPQFAVWMLTDKKWGVIQFAKKASTKKAIQDVSDAYQSVVNGTAKEVDWSQLRAAAYADADADAYAYAAAAAYADADADAAAAAYAAAAADADADADAYAYADADAAAYAAAAADADADADADAARNKWREAQADKLLELLAVAPVEVSQ